MDRPHLRSIGINEFLRWHKDGSLVLSPKFQRRRIWPQKAKSHLIDTILKGLPIPKLYLRQHLDLASTKTVHEIVDGQQRLTAVLEFHDDKFRVVSNDDSDRQVTYSQLSEEAQKNFLKYEFSVDVLIDAADSDVLDIFARINSYSVPLNAQEKRNAKYFGSFKNTVYGLGLEHLEFWKRHKILSDSTIARMREAELTSELMVGMIDGLQDKKASLDRFYEKWDDRFPYRKKATTRFRDIIDLLDRFLAGDLKSSRFRRPALFYSLFLAFYEIRYGSIGSMRGRQKALSDNTGEGLRANMHRLDDILSMEEPPKKYIRFVTACQRQTDNIQPRQLRHRTLVSELRK